MDNFNELFESGLKISNDRQRWLTSMAKSVTTYDKLNVGIGFLYGLRESQEVGSYIYNCINNCIAELQERRLCLRNM